MKIKKVIFYFFSMFAVISLNLHGYSGISYAAAPSVFFTLPAPGAGSVALNDIVTVTFSSEMNASTISGANFTIQDSFGNGVTGSISYDPTTLTATFAPLANLSPSTTYTINLSTAVLDATGTPLAAIYSANFTTGTVTDTVAPSVLNINPPANGTAVPTNAPIMAILSEPINPTAINAANVTLSTVSGVAVSTLSYNRTSQTLTITPTVKLSTSTQYTVSMKNFKDLANNLMPTFTWTFATGTGDDTTPPVVSSTTPANGTINVLTTTALTAIFDEDMNESTINTSTFTLKETISGNPVTGVVTFNHTSRTATFTPSISLGGNLQYTATITKGVANVANIPLIADVSWNFTTAADQTGGIKCFIATAAYGSYLDPHVQALREFRDKHLLTNPLGRKFVDFYYRNSPRVAGFIAQHAPLRFAVRSLLAPIVYTVEYPIGVFALICGVIFMRRRKNRGGNHV